MSAIETYEGLEKFQAEKNRKENLEESHSAESKWLNFVLSGEKPKTHIWSIQSKSGNQLGTVEWYANWRQYCFSAVGDEIIWSAGCLDGIQKFLVDANARHRGRKR